MQLKSSILTFALLAFLSIGCQQGSTNSIITESILIKSKPEIIWLQLSNSRNIGNWFPLFIKDRQAKYAYSGPVTGEKSRIDWAGEKNGRGRLLISKAVAAEEIEFEIKADLPYPSLSRNLITLKPKGDQTEIKWQVIEIEEGDKEFYRAQVKECLKKLNYMHDYN